MQHPQKQHHKSRNLNVRTRTTGPEQNAPFNMESDLSHNFLIIAGLPTTKIVFRKSEEHRASMEDGERL
jgi:hypothetical protein